MTHPAIQLKAGNVIYASFRKQRDLRTLAKEVVSTRTDTRWRREGDVLVRTVNGVRCEVYEVPGLGFLGEFQPALGCKAVTGPFKYVTDAQAAIARRAQNSHGAPA